MHFYSFINIFLCILIFVSCNRNAGYKNYVDQFERTNSTFVIPSGWRMPGESDIRNDWAVYGTATYIPYRFQSDFDQNGLDDQACILIKKDNTAFGVWILMQSETYQFNYLIEQFLMPEFYPQSLGISETITGKVETACGKGYFDCNPGEPAEIELKSPQIWMSPFDKGPGIVVAWSDEDKAFRKYQITD